MGEGHNASFDVFSTLTPSHARPALTATRPKFPVLAGPDPAMADGKQ